MALQSFGTNSNGIGAGVRAPLGTTDDAFVDFGATVSSSNTIAIYGSGSNQFVNVQGTVTAAGSAIIVGGGGQPTANNHILIGSGGYIGAFDPTDWAVYLQGSNSVLDNRGTIWSSGGYGVFASGDTGTMNLLNSGTIDASQIGIVHSSATDVLAINNSGVIKSTLALLGTAGAEQITNSGRITGVIDFGGGDDVYSGMAGHLAGHVLAGGGLDMIIGGIDNDWFDGGTENDALTGNGGNDTLFGQDGNDALNGGLGNDILLGGTGTDKLFGGAGIDKLTGSAGNDIFVFNTALNGSTNRDVITDFNHVNDTFQLENAIFAKLGAGVHALNPAFFHAGTAAADANDFVVYNQSTGALSYDNDGNGAHAAIAFAFLANHPVLAANDFLVI